jgi:phospholipid/cholesterol/gamma-HCH transport system substrate-binding protein
MTKKNTSTDIETRNTLRLGLFVSIGLILLIIAVYFIGFKRNMFSSTFTIYASFSDVNGLQKGDNVRFRGITIGTVKSIDVQNDSIIKVTMIFKEKIKPFIKKNAIASIITDGLMGNKMVRIRNENSPAGTIEENDVLKTAMPIDMDEVTQKLKSTNDNMNVITTNLSEITDKINKGKGALGELLSDTVVAKDLNQGIKNFKAGATNINQESSALKHNFLFRRYFKKKEEKKEEKK